MSISVKTVLFAHQSAEMYGSDKVLLYLVLGLKTKGFYPIVLLPEEGPLLAALSDGGVETHIVPITKLNRETLSLRGLISLPINLLKSVRATNRVLAGRKVDLVYSNTLAVLGTAIWTKVRGLPHIWHVHEILLSPSVVKRGFPWLLRALADKIICNSMMTEAWLVSEQPSLAARTVVIWNGQGPRPCIQTIGANSWRQQVGMLDGDLLVVLVGRINRWKGQSLFVNTATLLWERGFHNVHYLIVGSVFTGQEHLMDDLNRQISRSAARGHIHLAPFTSDIWSVWDACDIAVVPSTEPEPFGMVAIEAMAAIKPVVVAAHGGLLDIVEHEISGLHFKPNDPVAFANEIERLIQSPKLRNQLAQAGRERQQKLFSLTGQLASTVVLLHTMTKDAA